MVGSTEAIHLSDSRLRFPVPMTPHVSTCVMRVIRSC